MYKIILCSHFLRSFGMCLTDIGTFSYYSCLVPLLYFGFLRDFFNTDRPQLLFSYKAQVRVRYHVKPPHFTHCFPL